MEGKQVYLKPEEQEFLSMAVLRTLEELHDMEQNPTIPWTPEARKLMKDMTAAGKALKVKLEKLGFDMTMPPEFKTGDEQEFFTKQS